MPNGWPDRRHQPAVSHTSIAKFRECDRQWALQYHHAIVADINVRHEFKREARLQPLNCYPGSIFHEALQTALKQYQKTGRFPDDLMAVAVEIAREYRNFSQEWVADVKAHPILGGNHPYWPNHEFAQPIDCLYFEGKFPAGFLARAKENLARWFQRFGELLPTLPFMSVDPKNWHFPKTKAQKVPWFVYEDEFAVYAAFDFLTNSNGRIAIYDWKTGKRQKGEAQVADQLLTYAAYASAVWKTQSENIDLYAVWVDEGNIQKVECDPEELDRVAAAWRSHHDVWSLRLDRVNGDGDRLFDLFPMTQNLKTCLNCSFHSCEGRRRIGSAASAVLVDIEFYDG